MSVQGSISAAIFGSSDDEVIKAGTLAVTRGAGVIAVGVNALFALLDAADTGPWKTLDLNQKLIFVLTTAAIWAFIAAADSVARGLGTQGDAIAKGLATQQIAFLPLPGQLGATLTPGDDDPGWVVMGVQVSPGSTPPQYLITKGGAVKWTPADELRLDARQGG
jgi:hypothetical protein